MSKQVERQNAAQEVTPSRVPQREELPTYTPATDIIRRNGEYVVVADIPGVDQDHLEIEVERNILSIRGYVEPAAMEGRRIAHRGYEAAVYERSFTLPSDIDRDSIKATVEHGVLTLVLPKSKEAQPRKITVTAGQP